MLELFGYPIRYLGICSKFLKCYPGGNRLQSPPVYRFGLFILALARQHRETLASYAAEAASSWDLVAAELTGDQLGRYSAQQDGLLCSVRTTCSERSGNLGLT